MAINWSNPRLNALPCERMRGCTFAEDFVTWTRAQVNLASGYGSTFVMDHGLTTEEATLSFPTYPATPHDDQFTVVLQFNTSATSTAGTLAATGDFASNEDGFYIRVTATGVTATFYGNSTQETPLTVACDYADGETHTVTYVVDMTGNSHTLYVDDLDAATGATTVDETIGEDQPLGFGLYFEGEITKARTFGAVLTEEEHDVYHAGTVTSFLDMPWAVWRCDANSDNDAGALILDRTLNHRDLTKGDGATAATYPTWDSTNEKYEFDGVDDYVSGITTLPTAYTLSALKSTDAAPLPAIDQDTDSTYWDLITTTGDYTGYLHSLAIHNSTLTTIQKNHDEYQHLYWTRRKRAYGIIQRLIAEGVCQLCVMLDSSFDDPFDDLSQNEIAGTDTLVTGYGLDGCRFESATSNITYSDEANLRSDQGTIVFFGDFPSLGVDCHLLDKGTNYKFSITDTASFGYLNFQAQTYAYTPANNSMIAITFKDGEPVRYFIDGEYEGDSAGNVAITDSGTTDLVIGNNNETNEPSPYPLKHVLLCNRPLTDEEIKCLYEESTSINSGLGPGVSQVYLMTTDTGSLTLTTRGAAGTGLWIDWGDGSGATWVSHTDVDTDTDTAHTYSGAGRKRITVTGRLSDVTHFRCSDSSLVNDISEFTGFTALQDLRVHGSGVTGDLSGIAGMTTLTRIQLNGSSVTGSIASLAALTNLTFIHAYGIAFTGNMSDLSPLTELETLYLHSTAVGVDTGALAPWDDATIWAQDCSWTATEVDDFLIYLDAAGGDDGTADVSGTNATRTSASNAAKTSLEGRGWTITANNPA